MRTYVSLFAALAVCLTLETAPVFGHGFSITLEGNQMVGKFTDNPIGQQDRLYHQMLFNFDSNEHEMDHGGPVAAFSGNNFKGTVLGNLWYFDGVEAVEAPAGALLKMLDTTTGDFLTVDGSGVIGNPIDLAADNGHGVLWSMPQTSPAGIYGIAYQVDATNLSNVPYLTSNPLVVMTKVGAYNGDLAAAQTAIYNAAIGVPEPSTWALLCGGMATLAFVQRGLRRRRALQ
ncbi:MAG: PEP-CTERM sorting domain-containing protein [Planctomycetota bacterium]|nr:PEP-CTERM sorting domain-containing protein [Planctomycetota bacterium]